LSEAAEEDAAEVVEEQVEVVDVEDKKKKGGKTMTIKIPDKWKILTIVVLLMSIYTLNISLSNNRMLNSILAGGDGGEGLGAQEVAPLQGDQQPIQQPTQQQVPAVDAGADDDAFKGSANAAVTIIEFSDYECPFCTRFYEETLPLIEQNYIDTGKVKFVYRDYPLGFHPNAQKAAEAAECAGEQGKYWEMHDKLFDGGALDTTSLKQYAEDIGLDTASFNDCLDSGEMASEVQQDFSDGQSYGVSGTPSFFINGVLIVGAQPYDAFEQAIEQALS
jgi:protein-disulfide isomerase